VADTLEAQRHETRRLMEAQQNATALLLEAVRDLPGRIGGRTDTGARTLGRGGEPQRLRAVPSMRSTHGRRGEPELVQPEIVDMDVVDAAGPDAVVLNDTADPTKPGA
jgi:hypothetical protein